MTKVKVTVVTAIFCAVGFCTPAAALTKTFDIVASDFTLAFGDGSVAPIEPVDLDFTITANPNAVIHPTTTGLTVNTFTLPYPVNYAYDGSNDLTVATYSGIDSCGNTGSSFCVFISQPFTASPYVDFFQQETSTGGYYIAHTIELLSVPEPTAWALMLVGLGGVGAALRSRRSATIAA